MEESKNGVNLKSKIEEKQKELGEVKAKIGQIEQQVAQLARGKDQLLTRGIELQGMLKVLQELSPKPKEQKKPEEEKKKIELAEQK